MHVLIDILAVIGAWCLASALGAVVWIVAATTAKRRQRRREVERLLASVSGTHPAGRRRNRSDRWN